MSLLSNSIDTPITSTRLEEAGFIKSGWGSPDDRSKRGFLDMWNKSHHFWQYVSSKYDPKDIYTVVIWYFPEEFDGYVTPFNWHGKRAAGNVYITLDTKFGTSGDWYETMKVNNMLDIDAAIGIAVAKIKEFNKR